MSLTKVTYSMIVGSAANVKDFGATGDGVTDDTLAVQAAIDSLGDNKGTVYFPPGEYRISRNIGINDRWGIKITSSNVTLLGNQASLRRYNTDISSYALAYPVLFIGTPDSNSAATTTNVVVEGLSFIGENTRHSVSGGAISDFRTAIELKNTAHTRVDKCNFTAIDSSAIHYQQIASYDYANSAYYNTTKNYDSRVTNCVFLAESHAVAARALLHCIDCSGIDGLIVTDNYFEWCDDCISGETTYNTPNNVETDTFSYLSGGRVALGAVKRQGREWTFSNNVVYNSSEHAVYFSGVSVSVTDNKFYTTNPLICTAPPIKIRSKNAAVMGNVINNYTVGVSVSAPSYNVTVSNNTVYCNDVRDSDGGVFDYDSSDLETYINNRAAYLTQQPMTNFSLVGNTAYLSETFTPSDTTTQSAVRLYTPTAAPSSYPNGTLQNVNISGNTFRNYNIGVYFANGALSNVVINGNSFYAKNFTASGFSAATTLNTRAVLQARESGFGLALTSLRSATFTDNFVFGCTYILATNTAAGAAGTYTPPLSMVGNRFEYVKTIATADIAAFSTFNQFSKNAGLYFLDRTWSGQALDNSLGDATNSNNSFLRYTFRFSGGVVRFYTDDAGTYVSLN